MQGTRLLYCISVIELVEMSKYQRFELAQPKFSGTKKNYLLNNKFHFKIVVP